MSADTLRVYRHSGKFTLQGLALPLGAAAVAGWPLGLAYAFLTHWIPFIYFNVLLAFGYGAAFGWLGVWLLKLGKVRNTALTVLCGALVGAIALYFEWNGHLTLLFKPAPWLLAPDQIRRGIAYLYEHGSWSLHSGDPVTGVPLGLVWAAEAAIIVGMSIVLPYGFIATTPFCEQAQCWLDEEKKIDTLAVFTDAAQIGALGAGDIQPIVDAKPRPAGALSFARISLKRSPQSTQLATVRVQNVFIEIAGKGNAKEKVQPLTGDLIILPSMFEIIAQLEELKPAPA